MRKLWSQRWSRWGCSALFVAVGMAAACKGEQAGKASPAGAASAASPAGAASEGSSAASPASAPSATGAAPTPATSERGASSAAPSATAGSPAAGRAAPSATAGGATSGQLDQLGHDDGHGHQGHDHDGIDGDGDAAGDGANAGGAPEVEKISTARVVELAQASIRKMEELSARAAATKGNCPELAKALNAFYDENSTFIAEMNGLDEQMTKLQRRITEEKFTAPMQKAMTSLLEQMMSCRDDPAVAKAFLRLQR